MINEQPMSNPGPGLHPLPLTLTSQYPQVTPPPHSDTEFYTAATYTDPNPADCRDLLLPSNKTKYTKNNNIQFTVKTWKIILEALTKVLLGSWRHVLSHRGFVRRKLHILNALESAIPYLAGAEEWDVLRL